MSDTVHTKRFRVRAVIRYHREVGVFEAENSTDALKQAMRTREWDRISEASPGGICDTVIEAMPEEVKP